MRFLGGVVALLLVAAGCTTHTELEGDHDHDDRHRRYIVQHLQPAFPLLTFPEPQYLNGWQVDADGTVVRIGIDEETPRSGWFSFHADGTVVRVADSSVFIDRGDLTRWRITQVQLATVLGALDALGVRAAEADDFGDGSVSGIGPSGSVSWDQGRVIEGSDERLMDVLYAVTEPPAHGVRPWTPTSIGFLAGRPDRTARSPLTDKDPFAPWPLEQGIRELATGTARNAYDEEKLALCLVGRDAARVWRRLFTGVNTAYLRVDDGRRWELQSTVGLPGRPGYASTCLSR